jgi:hypothetical protein
MKWHVDVTRERFAEIAQHVEWTAIEHRVRILAKAPRTLSRLGPVPAIALATVALAASWWMHESVPSLRAVGMIGMWGFGGVLVAWALVYVQRARSPKSIAESRRRMVATLLRPTERKLPLALDYDLHDGQLDVVGAPKRAFTAHTAIATPLVVTLFRHRTSSLPWRIIHQPPAELLELLRERGTDVIVIDGPPAGYVDTVPSARIAR